jgi:hypothetical protein
MGTIAADRRYLFSGSFVNITILPIDDSGFSPFAQVIKV